MSMPPWLSILASIGMAGGPPLVYADQAYSIIKKRDSTGFSLDVCAILLLANITRCFYWLGNPFDRTLLIQSILMIIAQLALLYICICHRPRISPENLGTSSRPLSFWQWTTYLQYIEFLAGFILCQAILFLVLGRQSLYVTILGFVALGLESTLPIPQLISNYKQKSLYGFRMSTLLGWLGGDAFKYVWAIFLGYSRRLTRFASTNRTVYFFVTGSPLPFRVCAIFQLSVDFAILAQRIYYGNAPPPTVLMEEEDLEQALALDGE